MLSDDCYRLRGAAAVECLERIRLDWARAPRRLEPILAYLEEHLFDPGLNVQRLKRVFRVRDSSLTAQFQSAFGRGPRGYIEDRRFEIACRLLAADELKIWQISELLGFSGPGVFNKAFSRWAGESPSLYRRSAGRRSGGGRADRSSGGEGRFADRRFADPEGLRRAVAGELAAAEARELIERLWRRYPSLHGRSDRR